MLSLRVLTADLHENDLKNTGKIYFEELDKNVSTAKSLLDEPYKDRRYSKASYLFESFNCEKANVANLSKNINITNAWMKAYEIFDHYELMLIPEKGIPPKEFVHFDNASFPGSFILAAHHYMNTKSSIGNLYKWYASSLVNDTEVVKDHLEDEYCLFKNYPNRWLMSKKNNGDVSNPLNLLDFQKRLPRVNLYTSDLGFDVSKNYNSQETLHIPAHYGQLLCGLMVLKQGGHMVVKQYTLFHETNLSNLATLTHFFEEVYICKPATSKPDNSETYLIGKFFRGNISDIIISKMLGELGSCFKSTNIPRPLFDITMCGNAFLEGVGIALSMLADIQINKIEMNISAFKEIVEEKLKNPSKDIYELARHKFRDIRKLDLDSWYSKHKINPIHVSKKLYMKDAFNQNLQVRGSRGPSRVFTPKKTL